MVWVIEYKEKDGVLRKTTLIKDCTADYVREFFGLDKEDVIWYNIYTV